MWKINPRNNLHWNKFENECFQRVVVVDIIVHSNTCFTLTSIDLIDLKNRFNDVVIDRWESVCARYAITVKEKKSFFDLTIFFLGFFFFFFDKIDVFLY